MTAEQAKQIVEKAVKFAKGLEATYPALNTPAQLAGMNLMALALVSEMPVERETLLLISDAITEATAKAVEAAAQAGQ
jgi:hypothetical protein